MGQTSNFYNLLKDNENEVKEIKDFKDDSNKNVNNFNFNTSKTNNNNVNVNQATFKVFCKQQLINYDRNNQN